MESPTLPPTTLAVTIAPPTLTPKSTAVLQEEGIEDSPHIIQFSPWELVTAVAWAPNGMFLTIAAGNQIFFYDAITLSRIGAIEINALTPGVVYSPDGSQLAAGSRDGLVRLWNTADLFNSGQAPLPGANLALQNTAPAWVAQAHLKGVNDLVFSPDGKLLASGGNDGMARIWEVEQGKQVSQIIGGAYAVPALDFSPDGKTLALMNGKLIRLREVSSGRITGTLRADFPLSSMKFSPDGLILAASDNNNGVFFWDPSLAFRTGVEVYPKPLQLTGHNGKTSSTLALVWCVIFNPNGSLLASAGGDATIRLWSVADGELWETLVGHERAVTSLTFSPDGFRLASGGLDGSVRIWDLGKNLSDQTRSELAPALAWH